MKTLHQRNQIYAKIVTSADVIFEVLDARNPNGTRNEALEEFIRNNTRDKEIFLIINKIDLIPQQALDAWIDYFRKTTPYKIFSLSSLYSRGLVTFKRKLSHLFANKKTKAIITGYPNVGKSSLIQAFARDKKKIGISSRAGFTRGIIEIKITQNLYLLDTPGIIPLSDDSEIDQGIKGVINPEKIQDKEALVQTLLELYVTPEKVLEHFGVDEEFIREKLPTDAKRLIKNFLESKESKTLSYTDFELFIHLIGVKRGQLNPGGGVNENMVLNTIIHAWQKNKIKFYTMPPTTK